MIEMTTFQLPDEVISSPCLNYFTTSASWDYFHNTNMQEIIPGVFLGSYSVSLADLEGEGIRYIIRVRHTSEAQCVQPPINDPTFTYLNLDIADNESENILRFFATVNRFIDEALSRHCKVLVQGHSGNSRSATLVLAYIMEKFGLALSDALCLVKAKRASVNPNEGFKAQLSEYEPIYRARLTLTRGGSSSSDRSRPKRKSEQLFEATDICDYDLIPPPPSPIRYDNNNSSSPTASEFSSHLYMLWLAKR